MFQEIINSVATYFQWSPTGAVNYEHFILNEYYGFLTGKRKELSEPIWHFKTSFKSIYISQDRESGTGIWSRKDSVPSELYRMEPLLKLHYDRVTNIPAKPNNSRL